MWNEIFHLFILNEEISTYFSQEIFTVERV